MNRFKDAENVTELVYQLVGAGSTCWHGGTGQAVFNDGEATRVAEDGIGRLIELGWSPMMAGKHDVGVDYRSRRGRDSGQQTNQDRK